MIPAAAPAILEAAPLSATPATSAAPPAGFDAILLLQGLAGTAETLDTTALEADDITDSLAADDGADDDSDDDIEASLAFLANLIAATIPADSAGQFPAGTGAGTPDDTGGALPAGLDADGGFALTAAALTTDDAKPDTLLALAPASPEPSDPQSANDDAAQNLARAAELLAQAPRPAPEAARATVATHVRDPRWADDFGARVSLMVRAGESTASLQLTPVDLGPVEVSVSVKDSQATIHFGASQADTRALIEASLPRLRELLASQGFNLLDASVSSGFSRSKQPAFAANDRAGSEAEAPAAEVRTVRQIGLLDLYA